MATEDIERLKEKIEKDPNSKLFVPLAEEYKKAGMLDEAVDVLITGLERQPAYLSARVSLGKIYLERGSLAEAMAEFEKVIAAIPDNLYAHKKLAEIYKELGKTDSAIKEFKTVLKLNPMDEAAAADLDSMEPGEKAPSPEAAVEAPDQALPSQEEPEGVLPLQESQGESDEEQPAPSFNERDLAISEVLAEESETLPEMEEEAGEVVPGESEQGMWVDSAEAVGDFAGGPESPPKTPVSEEDMALWRAHLEEDEAVQEQGEVDVIPQAEELSGEEAISFGDVMEQPETAGEEGPAAAEAGGSHGVEDADRFIAEGQYGKAMSIYRAVLSSRPEDKRVLQRVEELRTLLKLLGKDKEELVMQMERFLEGVKKRRDELSGSA